MTNALNWLILLIVIATAGGSVYYTYHNVQPCTHPVAYSIGAIDPRFEVSTSTVLAEARAAAAVWNRAAGKAVLIYDPEAQMKISFIYDEREASAKLGARLAREQAALDSERESLDALHEQFAVEQAAYNQKVADSNARGGASGSAFASLEEERQSLKARGDSLNARARAFNERVAAFNTTAASYNTTAGHTFEEGHYRQDASGASIEIYEFVDTNQLERVLAHELGHAIGLDHNDDPKSIMYAQNESGKLTPSAADLAALKALCGVST